MFWSFSLFSFDGSQDAALHHQSILSGMYLIEDSVHKDLSVWLFQR